MDPVAPSRDARPRSIASEVFVGAVVVGVLYFARQVLVPIALAVLLSFILTPAVVRLRHLGMGQVPAVLAVVLLAFLAVGGIAGVIGTQITQLAGELPSYQSTLEQKIRSVRAAAAQGSIVRSLSEMLSGIQNEISRPAASAGPAAPEKVPGVAAQPPIPVVVRQPDVRPLETIKNIAGPLIEPLADTGIVVIFVIFILLQREDLRDRLIWLAGSRDLRRTTLAIDDAAERLARYFLAQTAINTAFGVIIGTGLWLIGVPSPVLWGVLAALLRYVPYVGSLIATALPLALAAAVDPGWSKVLWTVALFGTVELTVSQAIEPLMYGRSTGLSPVAVVVAATFWTWLWGPIGLVLSTPLTLLIVVVGQHVESLAFLAVMLGDGPVLTPAERFFQRVMSGDADETAEQGERFLEKAPLADYYDQVALPGLRLAQLEANRGMIEPENLRQIASTVEEVIENIADRAEEPAAAAKPAEGVPPRSEIGGDLKPEWHGTPVLCIAGRSPLDEAAAAMFRQLVQHKGIGVRIASFGAASPGQIFKLDTDGVAMICLSYLAVGGSPTHTRFLIRRLRRRSPTAKILAGFWTYQDDAVQLKELQTETGADFVATTLKQAMDICFREAMLQGEESGESLPERPRAIA